MCGVKNNVTANLHIGGFASGFYTCKCFDCGEQFIGSKRSYQCLSCASISVQTELLEMIAKEQDIMKDYRKLPVVIQAVQLTMATYQSVYDLLIISNVNAKAVPDGIVIPTLEGDMTASWGDFIIKGVNGEFYPCKPDIFSKTYEAMK